MLFRNSEIDILVRIILRFQQLWFAGVLGLITFVLLGLYSLYYFHYVSIILVTSLLSSFIFNHLSIQTLCFWLGSRFNKQDFTYTLIINYLVKLK